MSLISVRSAKLAVMVTLSLALVLSGCISRSSDNGTADEGGQAEAPQAEVAEGAPDPISVSAEDLTLIDMWRAHGVPTYRDSEVLDFDGHASAVENAGTILLDGSGDSPEEIIAFYRGALQATGWQERRVRPHELTARNDGAYLLVMASARDDNTVIMLNLTDAPDN